MSNLFIIGNGFDLAHGLKTSYHHFRDFLVQMEKKECAEAGEISISEDFTLLEDEKIKYHFNVIVIPTMLNTLSEITNLIQLNDCSTGIALSEQLDKIKQFHDDSDKIVQWIKHGSGNYYKREKKESKAIKRFIAMLEPETGIITHNTNLNNSSIFWQVMESEFGETAMNIFQNDVGADKTPFWLTLRLFIKMLDTVEGENWENLETSIGTYNFQFIFELFKELNSDDEIYSMCVENFFTLLYYNINILFALWVLFTEIAFEKQRDNNDIFSELHPHIKRKQRGFELSLVIKNTSSRDCSNYIHCLATPDKHFISKKQLIQIFDQDKTNIFFTFNYTQTLECIYNIPENQICHIHGMSQGAKNLNGIASEDLIFGHGLESSDSNVIDIIRTAYNITKKPVKQCIENNRLFLEKLEGIKNIYSFGFSFGDVDMPYIKKICESIHNTADITWYFNDFKIEENRMLYEEKIRKVGFLGKFDVFHVD